MINMFHPFSMVGINQQEFRRVRVPQSSMFFALRKLKVTEICARIAWWQVKLAANLPGLTSKFKFDGWR